MTSQRLQDLSPVGSLQFLSFHRTSLLSNRFVKQANSGMKPLWLQVRSGAARLSGPFLQENRGLYQIYPGAQQMVMVVGALADSSGRPDKVLLGDAQYGVWLNKLDDSTVLAHCTLHLGRTFERIRAGPTPGHLAVHQLQGLSQRPPVEIINRLYGEVLFPLSSVVLVFADYVGGLNPSARAVANWLRFSPLVDIRQPPRLLVSTDDLKITSEEFCRRVTEEMLQILREVDPGNAYNFAQLRTAWMLRVESVCIVPCSNDCNLDFTSSHLDEISRLRKLHMNRFSPAHFQLLLQHAVASFSRRDGSHGDMLRALGVRELGTDHARAAIHGFLTTQFVDENVDHATMLASCLVVNTYSPAAHSKSVRKETARLH